MNMISKVIHPSLGAWRAVRVETAIQMARSASEPLFGPLDCSHAQVCPQNPGKLTPEIVAQLREQNPSVQFRLHANAHVPGWSSLADASMFPQFQGYFADLRRISEAFGANGYTWHAGERRNATLDEVLDRTRALQDEWGIEVGIEGMYPTDNDRYILSTWGEYRTLLESGVSYALDLSHLNILAHRSGVRDDGLVADLLASPTCMEIHISGNSGDADTHGQLATEPWWWGLLKGANDQALIFSEGGQIRPTFF
jgi:hypothetical protein